MSTDEARLTPCKRTPNCVSTQAERPSQRMEPIPYVGPLSAARERMLRTLRSLPRTEIVEEGPALLRATCRSLLFRFVDDVEIRFDDTAKLIHFRSASRLGRRDFGVNRKRMETVRQEFLAQS
ncbi:MAG TPA: DUF1499 domain-containing protein [Thermoanaerobaculia bacterium]|nr:DUF1499 domain-containing protein [Thermoanaerobaculia bacterium]